MKPYPDIDVSKVCLPMNLNGFDDVLLGAKAKALSDPPPFFLRQKGVQHLFQQNDTVFYFTWSESPMPATYLLRRRQIRKQPV
jgi:hypothetical protein